MSSFHHLLSFPIHRFSKLSHTRKPVPDTQQGRAGTYSFYNLIPSFLKNFLLTSIKVLHRPRRHRPRRSALRLHPPLRALLQSRTRLQRAVHRPRPLGQSPRNNSLQRILRNNSHVLLRLRLPAPCSPPRILKTKRRIITLLPPHPNRRNEHLGLRHHQ
jgi:hypothetical protein